MAEDPTYIGGAESVKDKKIEPSEVSADSARTKQLSKTGRSGPNIIDEDGAHYYHNEITTDHNSEKNLTYVAYYRGNAQEQVISQLDHDTDTLTYEVLESNWGGGDDHTPASIEILEDGSVALAYANHEGNNQIHLCVSDTSGDISTISEVTTFSPANAHTYPYVEQQDGNIYIWYRRNFGPHTYIKTDKSGTWGGEYIAIQPVKESRVYAQKRMDSQGRLHMTLNDCGADVTPHNDVYYGYFSGGAFYDENDNQIATESEFPIDIDQFTQLYDSSAAGNHDTFSWDIAVDDETGDIAIVHSEFKTNNEHIYRYIRYDAEADEWWSDQLCHGGTSMASNQDIKFYSHGVSFEPGNPDKMVVSIGDRSSSQIYRYESPDDGETWEITEISDNATKNTRPRIPRNAHEDLKYLWMRGSYFDYKNYDTSLVYVGEDEPDANVPTPPIDTIMAGGTSLEVSGSTPTDVPGDDTWTTVEMQATNHRWLPNGVSDDENGVVLEGPGLYLICAHVQFAEISSSGPFEARIYDDTYLELPLAPGRVTCDAGDEPAFSASEFEIIRGSAQPLPDKIEIQVRQNTSGGETIPATPEKGRLTVYKLG